MHFRHVGAKFATLAFLIGVSSGSVAQSSPNEWRNQVPHEAFSEEWQNPFPNAILPKGSALEEANARTVLEFYDRAINRKDFAAALELIDAKFNQHKLNIPEGADGLKAVISDLSAQMPDAVVEVKRVVPDGEYVFLHSHFRPNKNDLGSIAGDIFRLENGRIIDRWSILHRIPENPSPQNPNGVFGGKDDGSRRN